MELIVCSDEQNQLHFKRGLLIHFHCCLLRDGIKRVSI